MLFIIALTYFAIVFAYKTINKVICQWKHFPLEAFLRHRRQLNHCLQELRGANKLQSNLLCHCRFDVVFLRIFMFEVFYYFLSLYFSYFSSLYLFLCVHIFVCFYLMVCLYIFVCLYMILYLYIFVFTMSLFFSLLVN